MQNTSYPLSKNRSKWCTSKTDKYVSLSYTCKFSDEIMIIFREWKFESLLLEYCVWTICLYTWTTFIRGQDWLQKYGEILYYLRRSYWCKQHFLIVFYVNSLLPKLKTGRSFVVLGGYLSHFSLSFDSCFMYCIGTFLCFWDMWNVERITKLVVSIFKCVWAVKTWMCIKLIICK